MTSPMQLGASLYVPATRSNLVEIGNRERFPHLRSVIFCTEDAIHSWQLPAALNNLAATLRRLHPSPLLRFVRVRDPGVLREVLAMDGSRHLAGFVLPKATRRNLPDYFRCIRAQNAHGVMVTLETAEVFDVVEMAAFRDLLLSGPYRPRILSLRIGGNDLLQLLGLRRPRGRSIYATPLGGVISQLVATFRPHGFNLTGPAFEFLNHKQSLIRETRRDMAQGLFGKSAIHPDQVPVIEAQYRVGGRDLESAERILAAGAEPVFRLNGAMCEPATHRRWAESIIERARIYGVRGSSPRVYALPATNSNDPVPPMSPPE